MSAFTPFVPGPGGEAAVTTALLGAAPGLSIVPGSLRVRESAVLTWDDSWLDSQDDGEPSAPATGRSLAFYDAVAHCLADRGQPA